MKKKKIPSKGFLVLTFTLTTLLLPPCLFVAPSAQPPPPTPSLGYVLVVVWFGMKYPPAHTFIHPSGEGRGGGRRARGSGWGVFTGCLGFWGSVGLHICIMFLKFFFFFHEHEHMREIYIYIYIFFFKNISGVKKSVFWEKRKTSFTLRINKTLRVFSCCHMLPMQIGRVKQIKMALPQARLPNPIQSNQQ